MTSGAEGVEPGDQSLARGGPLGPLAGAGALAGEASGHRGARTALWLTDLASQYPDSTVAGCLFGIAEATTVVLMGRRSVRMELEEDQEEELFDLLAISSPAGSLVDRQSHVQMDPADLEGC